MDENKKACLLELVAAADRNGGDLPPDVLNDIVLKYKIPREDLHEMLVTYEPREFYRHKGQWAIKPKF